MYTYSILTHASDRAKFISRVHKASFFILISYCLTLFACIRNAADILMRAEGDKYLRCDEPRLAVACAPLNVSVAGLVAFEATIKIYRTGRSERFRCRMMHQRVSQELK